MYMLPCQAWREIIAELAEFEEDEMTWQEIGQRLCLLQVQDLSKVYTIRKGSFLAADDISLDIPAGKMTALLGPSGSGAYHDKPIESITLHPEDRPMLRFGSELCQPLSAKQTASYRQDHTLAAHRRPGGALRRQHIL